MRITRILALFAGVVASAFSRAFREELADAICPELKERRNLAERERDHDAWTGLPNERAWLRALPAAEADPELKIVVFDMTGFKLINDLLGHEHGNTALRLVAAVLRSEASRYRLAARVFRIGGDEFGAILPLELALEFRAVVEQRVSGLSLTGPRIGMPGQEITLPLQIHGGVGPNFKQADALLYTRKRSAKAAAAAKGTAPGGNLWR